MKKTIFAFLLISVLFSCKKETSTPIINPNDVTISGFDCAGVAINGKLQKDQVASNVSVTITYSGGNGKTYLTKSHTSTGVTGLSASLLAGTLANGDGVLTYSITGIPNSIGTAIFEISLGNKTCSFSIKVDAISQNTTSGYGANVTDVDGNIYKTVYIGTQHWMGENLKVSKYNDGTSIPNITDNAEWSKLSTGAWSYYNNDVAYNVKYGKLYNWYSVSKTTNGNKNVCPTGWRVPTDTEWTVLIAYLGGDSVSYAKMKEVGTANWIAPNTDATNASLFTGLPVGTRNGNGSYEGIGNLGGWWSSTDVSIDDAWTRVLFSKLGYSIRSNCGKIVGLSVRCLKD